MFDSAFPVALDSVALKRKLRLASLASCRARTVFLCVFGDSEKRMSMWQVWCVKCEVWSLEWSVTCEARRVTYEVRSATCDVEGDV